MLLFGGSDSAGCAGLQMDLRTCAAFGVHGACVVTAVTAQSTRAVTGQLSVPASFVTLQAETVQSDLHPAAVKTGMLASSDTIEAVARFCERARPRFVVVDPVMVSTTGGLLLDPVAIEGLKRDLISRCSLVTPNLAEAEALCGRSVSSLDDMHEAAESLLALGAGAVLVKGGHLPGSAIDVFATPQGHDELHAPRSESLHTRGTGCALATAIAAALVRGLELREAVGFAKRWITRAIRSGYAVGDGSGPIDVLSQGTDPVGELPIPEPEAPTF